jgi:tetratricopeptide (TPR) repeat protein
VPAPKVRIRLLQKKQDYAAVIAEYQAVLADEPGWADGQRDLAWLLATCPDAKLRNAAQAIECAERARKLAIHLSWKGEVTLAAACAESRDFTKAAEHASQALGLRPSAEDAQEIQRQVKLYQRQKSTSRHQSRDGRGPRHLQPPDCRSPFSADSGRALRADGGHSPRLSSSRR